MNTENPLESVKNTLAFHVRDWSIGKRDAWLYGVVCGWDDEAMNDLAIQHGWSSDDVERLQRLHARWKELEEKG